MLIVGGGSNLLVADAGFDGTVVKIETRGVQADVSGCSGAILSVAAGENWDALVVRTLEEEFVGLEAMSGIPGLVGATPMQNVGAYGAEVSDSIETVRTYDRQEPRDPDIRGGRMRFLVPQLTLQGRNRPVRDLVGYLPTPAGVDVGTDSLPRTRPSPRGGGERSGTCHSRPGGSAGPPPRQGHGARWRRSGHVERGFLLHQPDP